MAETVISGVGGGVTMVSNFYGQFEEFTANLSLPTESFSKFGGGGFMVAVPTGGNQITGSLKGVLAFDAASLTPIPPTLLTGSAITSHSMQVGSMTLTYATACTHAFSACITGVDLTRPDAGRGTGNWSFVSNGLITQAWDVT